MDENPDRSRRDAPASYEDFGQSMTARTKCLENSEAGKDIIVHAPFNSDRSACLAIPTLQKIDASVKACQVVILVPTRESARQLQDLLLHLAEFIQAECYACVWPVARNDENPLPNGQQIVIGTPSRIHDMMLRRVLNLDSMTMTVVDEADEILARGFTEQVYSIFQLVPPLIQVVMSTFTMIQDVLDVSKRVMRDPVRIFIEKTEPSYDGIAHFHIVVEKEELKLGTLSNLDDLTTTTPTVIFCNYRRTVEWLAGMLIAQGINFAAMHGDMDAWLRADIMKEFRSGSSQVLLATDLLARGLDLQQIPLVINYDLPTTCEKYQSRMGGRGRKGSVVNLVHADEVPMIRELEQFYNTKIVEMTDDIVFSGKSETMLFCDGCYIAGGRTEVPNTVFLRGDDEMLVAIIRTSASL